MTDPTTHRLLVEATLAERYFAADRAQMALHDDVGDVLDRAFPDGWGDWNADYYDESIEVYFPGLVATDHALAVLAEAGFKRCWIHDHAYAGSRSSLPEGGDCSQRCRCRGLTAPIRDSRTANAGEEEASEDIGEADQCGVVGDPRDVSSPVCVLPPGHAGEHRRAVYGTAPIATGFAAEVAWHREQREARPVELVKDARSDEAVFAAAVASLPPGTVERAAEKLRAWRGAPTALTKEREAEIRKAIAEERARPLRAVSTTNVPLSMTYDLLAALDASRTALAEAQATGLRALDTADMMLHRQEAAVEEATSLRARLAEAEERARVWQAKAENQAIGRELDEKRANGALRFAADATSDLGAQVVAAIAARDAALADAARLREAVLDERAALGAEEDARGNRERGSREPLAPVVACRKAAVAALDDALAASPSTAWLEAKVREARVVALREAAAEVERSQAGYLDDLITRRSFVVWLRHQAASIEAGTTGEP